MNYLIDTHSFLWFVEGNTNLSKTARFHMEDETAALFLSVASVWEIAIKFSLGKLELTQPYDVFIPQQLVTNDIELLPITLLHTGAIIPLPLHHRDPFDRLIIAQSITEQMPIISKDGIFDAYGVVRIWE